MADEGSSPLILPFGTANPENAVAVTARRRAAGEEDAGNVITLDPAETPAPLRLHHGPYDFRATPGLGAASDTESRVGLIRDHLHTLCDLWRKAQHAFIDAYFGLIDAALEAEREPLSAALADYGGLYHYRDWAFSALRPLPRAHIPLAETAYVAMDFAFWTEDGLLAIDLTGFQTPTKSRRADLTALGDNGVVILEIDGTRLAEDGVAYLETLLPAPFRRFWEGEALPQSPFKPKIADAVSVGAVRF